MRDKKNKKLQKNMFYPRCILLKLTIFGRINKYRYFTLVYNEYYFLKTNLK